MHLRLVFPFYLFIWKPKEDHHLLFANKEIISTFVRQTFRFCKLANIWYHINLDSHSWPLSVFSTGVFHQRRKEKHTLPGPRLTRYVHLRAAHTLEATQAARHRVGLRVITRQGRAEPERPNQTTKTHNPAVLNSLHTR